MEIVLLISLAVQINGRRDFSIQKEEYNFP